MNWAVQLIEGMIINLALCLIYLVLRVCTYKNWLFPILEIFW